MIHSNTCLLIATALFTAACYSSAGPAGDVSLPDPAPDTVHDPAVDHHDAPLPDLPSDPEPEPDAPPPACVTDSDCVVYLNEDRCCQTCAGVMPMSEFLENPCLHALGSSFPFPEPNMECMRDCDHCDTCPYLSPTYMARCENNACEPINDACNFPDITPLVPVLSGTDLFDRDRYAPYVGQLVEITGTFMPGPDSCACCFDCFCDCFDEAVDLTIDCAVVLRGNICGERVGCTGTECSGTCTPFSHAVGGAFGFLVPYEFDLPELWVISYGIYWD
jgi:hypothetical protein